MAIRIKDTASLAAKFRRNATAAQTDYSDGVKAAGADWESGARAGAENYKQAVTMAANEGRFERGISAAGSAKYVKRASELGPARFGTGVAAAENDWSKGAGPYLDALKSIDLPPRSPKGSPNNIARVQAVAAKLNAMRLGK